MSNPSSAPLASIIIPVYNEEGLLQTAVHDLIVRLSEELPKLARALGSLSSRVPQPWVLPWRERSQGRPRPVLAGRAVG